MIDQELKDNIYKVIEEYIGNPDKMSNTCHIVAQDFSETELDKFINVYYAYFMK